MPLYEFRCEQCGRIEEILVSGFDHKELDERCECGGKLKRIFSTTADVRSSSGSDVSAATCTPSS